MTLRTSYNILLVGLTVWWLLQGFCGSWAITVLPLLAVVWGSIAGCVPGRSAAVVNAVCSTAGSLALVPGMLVTVAGAIFLMFGDSPAPIAQANRDAYRLGIL